MHLFLVQGQIKIEQANTGSEVIVAFNFINEEVVSSFHWNASFFNKSVMGAVREA